MNQLPEHVDTFVKTLTSPASRNAIFAPAPEGKYYVVGEDSIPIDKSLLYYVFDQERQAYRVRLQNLKATELVWERIADYAQVQKSFANGLPLKKRVPNIDLRTCFASMRSGPRKRDA